MWRGWLETKYKQDRKKIRFGRHRKAVADMDDIFVDLTLIEERAKGPTEGSVNPNNMLALTEDKDNDPGKLFQDVGHDVYIGGAAKDARGNTYRKLESYSELFTIPLPISKEENEITENPALLTKQGNRERFVNHILLQGPAGSGKTTLLSRVAYLWANSQPVSKGKGSDASTLDNDKLFKEFHLVFLLELRKLGQRESLECAIQKQLLPGVALEEIASVMSMLGTGCVVFLDGFDEIPKDLDALALESPLLSRCCVIVTTRSHMVDDFYQMPDKSGYAHVRISGFAPNDSEKYIQKFFSLTNLTNQTALGSALIERMCETPILQTLSSFPILLVMMCLLWEYSQTNERKDSQTNETRFHSMTSLYENAVKYLNKPFQKPKPPLLQQTLDNILCHLGRPALEALFDNAVRIRSDRFDQHILEESFEFGLTIEEEGALVGETYITFVHKTFQEFSAAKYLVNLYKCDNQAFNFMLKKISRANMFDMEYVLQFCCGLCPDAAQVILRHVVGLCLKLRILYTYTSEETRWSLPLLLLYEAEVCNLTEATDKLHSELAPLKDLEIVVNRNIVLMALCHLAVSEHSNKHVWSQNLRRVSITQTKTDGNRFIGDLGRMEHLEHLALYLLELSMNSVIHVDGWFRSLRVLDIAECTMNTNSLVSLLTCMPPAVSVELRAVTLLSKWSEKLNLSRDYKGSLFCKSVSNHLSNNPVMRLLACMPSVRSVSLGERYGKVKLESDVEIHISTSRESIIDFSMQNASLSANTMMRLLGCMPSVMLVTLGGKYGKVMIEDDVDVNISASCGLLRSFRMKNASLSANTLMRLLGCMPSVELVKLGGKYGKMMIEGEVDVNISAFCGLLRSFRMKNASLSANTLMRLLGCMPSVKSVTLGKRGGHGKVEIEGEVDVNISASCELLTDFNVKNASLSANTMMRLLGCMPSVKSVTLGEWGGLGKVVITLGEWGGHDKVEMTLGEVEIEGEVDVNISASCELLTDFNVQNASLSANILMRLLGCMPSVTSVTLGGRYGKVMIEDDVDVNISASCELLTDFNMQNASLSANTMMRLLGCMPSVKSVTLGEWDDDGKVEIKGEVDRNISASYESLTYFNMQNASLSANTMMRLLGCMPSVKSVTLGLWHGKVMIEGEVDVNISASCGLLTDFRMKNASLSANTMMRLLGCMPSVKSVTLGGRYSKMMIEDDVDVKISASCGLLTDFRMKNASLSANTLMRLLGCMPSVKSVTLGEWGGHGKVEIEGEVDVKISASCGLLTDFRMKNASLSANTMMRLLGCMPAVKSVMLGGQYSEVKLEGEVDITISASSESLTDFTMRNASLSTNTMMRLLGCMMPETSVTFCKGRLIGDVHRYWGDFKHCRGASILPQQAQLGRPLRVNMCGGHVNAKTLIRLVQCVELLTSVVHKKVDVVRKVDASSSIAPLRSLTNVQMFGSLHMEKPLRILICLLTATSVKCYKAMLDVEIIESLPVSCESLKEFELTDGSPSANILMGLLAGSLPPELSSASDWLYSSWQTKVVLYNGMFQEWIRQKVQHTLCENPYYTHCTLLPSNTVVVIGLYNDARYLMMQDMDDGHYEGHRSYTL